MNNSKLFLVFSFLCIATPAVGMDQREQLHKDVAERNEQMRQNIKATADKIKSSNPNPNVQKVLESLNSFAAQIEQNNQKIAESICPTTSTTQDKHEQPEQKNLTKKVDPKTFPSTVPKEEIDDFIAKNSDFSDSTPSAEQPTLEEIDNFITQNTQTTSSKKTEVAFNVDSLHERAEERKKKYGELLKDLKTKFRENEELNAKLYESEDDTFDIKKNPFWKTPTFKFICLGTTLLAVALLYEKFIKEKDEDNAVE